MDICHCWVKTDLFEKLSAKERIDEKKISIMKNFLELDLIDDKNIVYYKIGGKEVEVDFAAQNRNFYDSLENAGKIKYIGMGIFSHILNEKDGWYEE